MRGATFSTREIIIEYWISTHAPHARCDSFSSLNCLRAFISTHAPHARCDKMKIPLERWNIDFNSRTSCEVRPKAEMAKTQNEIISTHAPHARCDFRPWSGIFRQELFQLTHLMRGATLVQISDTVMSIFQLTHLMRGATIFGRQQRG